MIYRIRHRVTGDTLAEVELPAKYSEMPESVTLGKAIKIAIEQGAGLHEANLYRADLRRANLRRADLHGADLCEANLHLAVLIGADLSRADLIGADMRRADMRGANLYRADLSEANLYRADLHGADMRGADMRGADLCEANLHLAVLRRAVLRRADLRRADLSEADLSEAVLDGATGIIDGGYDSRGYRFVAVRHDDGLRVAAGCRWFTLPEARKHWGGDDRATNAKCRAIVERLVNAARNAGWKIGDEE